VHYIGIISVPSYSGEPGPGQAINAHTSKDTTFQYCCCRTRNDAHNADTTKQSWPETRWQLPTHCLEWQAADAVAHLATGGDFYAPVIAAGCQGEPRLPWGASDAAGTRAARAAASQRLVDGGPTALIEGFQQGAAQLQGVLELLQAAGLSKVAWHPCGLVPIGSWVGMRLTELVVHDWDIRQPHADPRTSRSDGYTGDALYAPGDADAVSQPMSGRRSGWGARAARW
jgi:uncharacterized protein (TIGR03083 family)